MDAEQLVFSHPFWTWISVGAIFLIGELLTGSGWLLWPAGAAAAVALLTLIGVTGPWQVVAFAVLAVVATYLGRRFMPPPAKSEVDINDQAPRLVGQSGESVSAFAGGCGRVFVDGKEWAAELDGGGDLAARQKVEVIAILGGARLRVRPA